MLIVTVSVCLSVELSAFLITYFIIGYSKIYYFSVDYNGLNLISSSLLVHMNF